MKLKRGRRLLSLLCVLICLCVSAAAAPVQPRLEPEDEGGVMTEPEPTPEPTPEPEEDVGGIRSEDEEYVNPYAPSEEEPEVAEDDEPEVYEPINLDSFTGEPINHFSSSMVTLSSACTYDRVLDEFIYQINNTAGSTITANIPNGAAVQQYVELQVPDNLMPVLYRNGTALDNPDFSKITEKGIYSLSLNRDGEITPGVFTFTILGNMMGQSYLFTAPSLFPVRSAEGPSGGIVYSDFEVPLNEEGEYTITYGNSVIDKYFTVTFTVDNTAPVLRVVGPDENSIARCPVLLYDYDTADTLTIYKDKVQITNTLQLTETGSYTVIVTDAAGNSNTYSFTIRTYLDTMSWVFMGVLTLLAAAAVFFIVFKRKKFRSN